MSVQKIAHDHLTPEEHRQFYFGKTASTFEVFVYFEMIQSCGYCKTESSKYSVPRLELEGMRINGMVKPENIDEVVESLLKKHGLN